MMYQSFWFGVDLDDLLFHGFSIHSAGALIWLCIGLIVLTVLFEGLKVLQIKAKMQSILLGKTSSVSRISDSEPFMNNRYTNQGGRRFSWFLAEVVLYMIQIISGYIIMLVVMTYNSYIALSVLFGASIGYAVFGAILMTHRIQNAKLVTPCQHCISTPRDDSPQTTILEDEGGCCSTSNENEAGLPPLVHTPLDTKIKSTRSNPSTTTDTSCHHEDKSPKVDEKSLLTPD